jgi:hypothetical protein
VYQKKDDPLQYVGCDHPSHPTRKFIAGHMWRYIRDTEKIPIQSTQKVRPTLIRFESL